MCVCVCVCVCVCSCVFMCMCMFMYMYVCIHVWVCVLKVHVIHMLMYEMCLAASLDYNGATVIKIDYKQQGLLLLFAPFIHLADCWW